MSEESISTIIRLKDKLLTEKYKELHTETSQQKTMKVFAWGGIAFMFVGMFLKNQMSTSVEVILGISGFVAMYYGFYNMPKDEDLKKIEDEIEIAKREIQDLEEQENKIENTIISSKEEENTASDSKEENISSTSREKIAAYEEAQIPSWLKKLYRP